MRLILSLLLLFISVQLKAQTVSTSRPWTYWWWMGSAVTKNDISAQLEYFNKAGIGGVHIIPIYGAKGYESGYIPFLSPEWIDVMQYTVQEGNRLGMGVDMTTGTGWPFGGPNVPLDRAAKNMKPVNEKLDVTLTEQKVKRAAPGGEGYVLDPFHPSAMTQYLSRFDSAFANARNLPRSMYNDSYEAYGANWTTDFPEQFQKRRRYEIGKQQSLLIDSTNKEDGILVKIDYHQTLAELLRERYALPWTQWSKAHGFLTRYQAHGSPGNLLDLYETADIPETESFGTSRFAIPGLRIDPDYSINQFGTPNPLAMKFASSAANFSGKKLVSSETGTWLANHFKVSLSQIKPQIDELFTAGINHIFYHGATYSPENETYPGWLFYASTNFGKNAHFAEHFPFLNDYVQRTQERLQSSVSDNDILLYFPIHDLWATQAKSPGNVHLLEVHHVDRWLLDLPFGKLAQWLWKEGFTFDYVSDLQLGRLNVDENGNVITGNTSYKTVLIPASTYMPEETLAELKRLSGAGAKIIFDQHTPAKITGFYNHESRQKSFADDISNLLKNKNSKVSGSLTKDLIANGAMQEELAGKGLSFIRKKTGDGKALYFVANLGNTFKEDWIAVSKPALFSKYDPLQGESSLPHRTNKGKTEIFLSLLPGQSCFLQETHTASTVPFRNFKPNELVINGSWELTFLEGRPHIPAAAKLNELKSWTMLPDSAVYFSGKARYKIRFDIPRQLLGSKSVLLDLGDVREVATVTLNGKSIGTAWSIPFQLPLNKVLKSKNNILEIEVTNLSANYMRLRDQQAPEWKKFYDINIVDITYKKFDASKWDPMPSGLLGPVKLIYY
ncbi:glycosyl hydrolase [Dyadobacter sediminis]|uniref:Glycoside hydrolase n=1 Tax=Dyadobacter sediminis TaxID=1493691 RepID=A0A5R9K7M4_9BACT|nr:glycosyl hydrolase [Dyadobacter sediminis]TLU89851.1 glycoside hydrolase [Dyadobacter sediminis]GGC12305.1 glycosyl hydrolase family 2 [Dyadobacter sediminis]